MFGRLFKKKPSAQPPAQLLVAKLNARLQPMHRGEFFEDPLGAVLRATGTCEVSGGGTLQDVNGEIESCDNEIQCADAGKKAVDLIVSTLERRGVPKGSMLTIEATGAEPPFGVTEGLAFYLCGSSFDTMKQLIAGFFASHPLCARCRIEQVA